jgi:hypothetical protein
MRWIIGLVVYITATAATVYGLGHIASGLKISLSGAAERSTDELDEETDEDPQYRDAPPIIPEAEGFGVNSYAGSGRHRRPFHTAVLRVSNLYDSGRGSLRECVAHPGPRTCIFEVAGEIQLRSALRATSPYLTIAGQTAPAPGITVRGGTLRIETHDVLVQHIAVRPGDNRDGVPPSQRDGITIGVEGPRSSAHHVVLDHVSVTWALDENISTWYRTTRNITISNSIIAEGLDHSIHPKGPHSKGLMIGDGSRRISVIRNLIANNIERNPYLKPGTSVEFVNNVVYGWGPKGGWALCNISDNVGRGEPVLLSFIGNTYKPGAWSFRGAALYGKDVAPATRIFVQGNIGPTRSSDAQPEWQIASVPANPHRSSSPPFKAARTRRISAEQAYQLVLDNAGSRPRRRSDIDARIVAEVRSGTGGIKDCITGCRNAVGLMRAEAHNTKPLTIPGDPFTEAHSTRYTRLEQWLHTMARAVE